MPQLNTFVHVESGNGEMHVFGPGDVVPDWAVAAITNPMVWADGGDVRPDPPAAAAAEPEAEPEAPAARRGRKPAGAKEAA
ncbi:hypothetical protein AB0E01_23075 [Nocardia vinacea]|uniref:hypothetical protein n=1 Tax=Nocardia vinacea TaxID=96468 RepID=UPI00340A60AA